MSALGSGKKRKRSMVAVTSLTSGGYEPPPEHACNVVENPLDLVQDQEDGVQHVLYHKAHYYRGKVVWFCLEQTVRADDDVSKVVRVDTEHGTVHIHRYTKSDQDGTRETLLVIPAQGHDVVDEQYNVWLDRLLDDWAENLRRWRGC